MSDYAGAWATRIEELQYLTGRLWPTNPDWQVWTTPRQVHAQVFVEPGTSYSTHHLVGFGSIVDSRTVIGAATPGDLLDLHLLALDTVIEKARTVLGFGTATETADTDGVAS